MLVNLSLSPGYRLKITRASRMSELADRVITAIAAVAGEPPSWKSSSTASAPPGAVPARRPGAGSWRRATPSARRPISAGYIEALQGLAEERERRHDAELLALEAQMQAKQEALPGPTQGQRCPYLAP